MGDDKITKLPVRFKDQSEQMFEDTGPRAVKPGRCRHRDAPLLINSDLSYVECGDCGAHLNPMVVLSWLAQGETRWHRSRERYQEEMERLKKRSRTRCRHCGEMTPISRR